MTMFLALLDITLKNKVVWSRSAPCVTDSPLGLISGSLHFSSIVRTVKAQVKNVFIFKHFHILLCHVHHTTADPMRRVEVRALLGVSLSKTCASVQWSKAFWEFNVTGD